jgi:hypothetical protein
MKEGTMNVMARKSVSEKRAVILEAIRRCGAGWHSRAEIAAQLGKRRLNPTEATLLETLVESGEVEAERHEIDAPIPIRWEYRIKE